MRTQKDNEEVVFLIIGDGTEYVKLENFVKNEKQNNVRVLKKIPKDDYDRLVAACDVGMLFLDYRFTIPNFPSRLLSYMQAGLPVLACTDVNTDVGQIIMDGKLGWWCESNNTEKFAELVSTITKQDLKEMSINNWKYLCKHYNVVEVYKKMMDCLEKVY